MLSQKELLVLSHLRQNARETLTMLSKKTHVPISTIFDKLKLYDKDLIKKHTTLIDFARLGFNTRANVVIKVGRDQRVEIQEYLMKHQNINSVYKINNGFDFLAECVFKHIKDLEDFMENLDEKFKVEEKQVYYVIEDIKREGFMADPMTLNLVSGS